MKTTNYFRSYEDLIVDTAHLVRPLGILTELGEDRKDGQIDLLLKEAGKLVTTITVKVGEYSVQEANWFKNGVLRAVARHYAPDIVPL